MLIIVPLPLFLPGPSHFAFPTGTTHPLFPLQKRAGLQGEPPNGRKQGTTGQSRSFHIEMGQRKPIGERVLRSSKRIRDPPAPTFRSTKKVPRRITVTSHTQRT